MSWIVGLGWLLLHAEPVESTVRMQWIAPASCPSEMEVVGRTEAWLERSASERSGIGVRGVVLPDPGGLRLELRIDTPDGVIEQGATSLDCGSLAEATALQVAMAIDPEAVAAEIEARAEADLAEVDRLIEELAAADEPNTSDEPTAPPTSPRWTTPGPRGAAWIEGSVGGGRVPRLDGRIGGGGSLLLPLVRIDLGVVYTARQRQAHPALAGVGLDVWQWGAVARGCARPRLGPVELPVCGGGELGVTAGRGQGVAQVRIARTAWLAGLASAGVSWAPWRSLAIGVAVQGFVALRRGPFTVDALEPFFTPTIAGGAGLVRVEGRFL